MVFPCQVLIEKNVLGLLIQENGKLASRSVFPWFYHDILLISYMYIIRFSNNAGMAFQQEG